MNTQQRAEAYVRKQIPELMELSFGFKFHWEANTSDYEGSYTVTQVEKNGKHITVMAVKDVPRRDIEDTCKFDERILDEEDTVILGHPILLHHWLRVLKETNHPYLYHSALISSKVILITTAGEETHDISFSLLTGQPASEKDYQCICNIFGV